MATNRRELKAYVRYDGTGRAVPGGNILRNKEPKQGNWKEINAYECCNAAVLTGEWLLSDVYAPPGVDGYMVFPDHLGGVASLNPNDVGTLSPGSATMLYININDLTGTSQSRLGLMAGRNGSLTLTQNADSVTYSFTVDAFMYAPGWGVAFDWMFGSSIFGSLLVSNPASGNFNTTDPITITITLT